MTQVCLAGGIVSLCVFLAPGFRGAMDRDQGVERHSTRATIGLPSAPWSEWSRSTLDGQLVQQEFRVHWNSRSWVFLGLAVGFFWGHRRLSGMN
jgi:hypothetical protein